MECACCGGVEEWRINGRAPGAEMLPKHFANKGWDIKRRSCPECQMKRKDKTVNKLAVTATPSLSVVKPAIAATDAARQAKQLLFLELLDHYDAGNHCYKNGKTDAILAKALDISEQFVRQVREQDFGPLKEPQEIREFRDRINAINEQSLTFAAEAKDLHVKLNALCKANGWMS